MEDLETTKDSKNDYENKYENIVTSKLN